MEEYSIPIDELAHVEQESRSSKRMPGQRNAWPKSSADLGVATAQPAPEGAPRKLADIPIAFRKPAKPPTTMRRSNDHE